MADTLKGGALDGNAAEAVDAHDEAHLAKLGYKQELSRNVTFWGSCGITLGCMQPLLSAGVFYYAYGWGGPVEVVWGFVGCFVWSTFLALSMAEISSQYTVAGGPYYWAGALAGKFGRFPPYVLGWVLYLSYIGGIVSYEFQATQQLLAMRLMWANGKLGTPPGALGNTDSVPFGIPLPNERSPPFQNAMFGIMVCFTVFHSAINFLPVSRINTLALCSFTWLLFGAAVLMFVLPGVTPTRNDGAHIFGEWIPSSQDFLSATTLSSAPAPAPAPLAANATASATSATDAAAALIGPANVGMVTALKTDGWTAMVGLLMSQYLILVYDTPSHMAEETSNAGRIVPRAIMFSFVLGCLLNLGILISYLACLNLDNYMYDFLFGTPLSAPDKQIAAGNFLYGGVTYGMFPVGNIFYDSFMGRYGRADGAVFLTFIIFLGTHFTGMLTFCCATRFLYSFARDGGLPFSKFFSYVEPRSGVPINCLLLMTVSVICFITPVLTENWFLKISAEAGIQANGTLFVYGVPCLLRMINSNAFLPANDFRLGRLSIPCALLGVAYTTFSVATIAVPTFMPATELTLNYAPVVLGCVITFAVVTFPFAGPLFNFYRGPAQGDWDNLTAYRGQENPSVAEGNELDVIHASKAAAAAGKEGKEEPAKM